MPNENNTNIMLHSTNKQLDANLITSIENNARNRCKIIGQNQNCPIEFGQLLENMWRVLDQKRINNSDELKEKQQERKNCESQISETRDLIDKKNSEKIQLINNKQAAIQEKYENKIKEKETFYDNQIKDKTNKIEANKQEIEKIRENIRKEYDSIPFIPKTNIRLIMEILLGFLLLCYLWIFYSTATYSAFFKDADSLSSNIVSVFLDPTAMSSAWAQGWGVGLFITLFPFIFVALGYITFTKENSVDNSDTEQNRGFFTNITKRMQVIGILCGAFVYDVLIAYIIAENVYKQTIELGREQQFNLHICLRDPHFWLIIGGGFIVYLIFGWICNIASERWGNLNPQENNINKYEQQIKLYEAQNKQLYDDKMVDESNKFEDVRKLKSDCSDESKNVEEEDSQVGALKNRIKDYLGNIDTYNKKLEQLDIEINMIKQDNTIAVNDRPLLMACRDGWISHLANIGNQDLVTQCLKIYDEFISRHKKNTEL